MGKKTSNATPAITGNRLALKRTLEHLMANLEHVDGIALCVEFHKSVKDPEGIESEDPTTHGYIVALDLRSLEWIQTSDAPHLNCTSLTAGLANRISQRLSFSRSLLG